MSRVSEFPVVPLVFEAGGDDEAEWWRVCRDCFERLGWGFVKSANAANDAASDASVVFSRSPKTVGARAKREGWVKGAVSVRTDDERLLQTEAARVERRRGWVERREELAAVQGDIAAAAAAELLEYLGQSIEERKFAKSVHVGEFGESSTFEDGSARAQRTATIMGIAIDKADQLVKDLGVDVGAADAVSKEDKIDRLAPLFRKIEEGIEAAQAK